MEKMQKRRQRLSGCILNVGEMKEMKTVDETENRGRKERETQLYSSKNVERENALEHPFLKGFSTGWPSEEGALSRTGLCFSLRASHSDLLWLVSVPH